jgi:CBS domain-containing protein
MQPNAAHHVLLEAKSPGEGRNRSFARQEDAMTVKAILEAKGHDVFTLSPNERLSEAIRLLAEHRIGALVITNGDRKIVGILSERDVVRVLAREGGAALDMPVRSAMTPKVKICNENHTVNEIMEIMTTGRFRHLPVEKDGLLSGIISIGDVVKRRIEDVEREAEEMKAYIATA